MCGLNLNEKKRKKAVTQNGEEKNGGNADKC